jgi:hypothetical protein
VAGLLAIGLGAGILVIKPRGAPDDQNLFPAPAAPGKDQAYANAWP